MLTLSSNPGAANRFPDKVDKDPEGTRKLNVEATRDLAKLCAERNVLLIYVSTDYVFSGKPGEAPYEADAPTGPTNLYGQTKLDGEQAMLEAVKAAGKENLGVVLRVPVLYGDAEMPSESAVNVLMDALWKSQQGEKVKMEHWALRYPTNTEDVGRVCHGESRRYTNTAPLPCPGSEIGRLINSKTWPLNTSPRILPTSCPGSCSSRVRTSSPSMRSASSLARSWASAWTASSPTRRATILMRPCRGRTTAT